MYKKTLNGTFTGLRKNLYSIGKNRPVRMELRSTP